MNCAIGMAYLLTCNSDAPSAVTPKSTGKSKTTASADKKSKIPPLRYYFCITILSLQRVNIIYSASKSSTKGKKKLESTPANSGDEDV
jgi:hypothetical protein